jgi:nucleotide-binding universal stress UspA family protein
MKTLVFPTDFSQNSIQAIRYGIQLMNGEAFHAILLHAYEVSAIPLGEPAVFPENYLSELISKANKGLNRVLSILEEEENLRLADFILVSKLGPLAPVVNEIVTEYKPSLVVMGTHGAKSIQKKLIGTNTFDVIKNVKCPVLAIPKNHPFISPKKIVFSTDYKPIKNKNRLEPISWIANQYQSSINILNITKSKKIDDTQTAAEGLKLHHFLDGINHYFNFVENDDVETGIAEFLKNNPCQMLVMAIHDLPFFERIFHPSLIKKMAFKSDIPLLTLHA